MRKVYRNPRELATCLKDIVDVYLEDLMTYETMESKILAIVEANRDRVYKEKNMNVNISKYLGDERVEIIDKIVKNDMK
ncbi:TIGR04540 family protein [Clostridium sp. NSJ-49]|uniref:Uncharacterized protein n=1 Tax=Clostridium disporicum TaxID=84024 RepID=A0A174DA85_9CLOT|nr:MULTISPECIES: TIGR04540 family protein [Clostridium]MBC5624905.1 TIGR04540 family protein [Clostridium sp. NSJ-49]MCD2500634.1 TIGR04540 family protein [Clostridium sp. NSJ-145]MDU6340107.1 TIGR04540 family protein [Clostridium sp.]CUO20960.1 Uncharacterised protein [Clostridium disporicum]